MLKKLSDWALCQLCTPGLPAITEAWNRPFSDRSLVEHGARQAGLGTALVSWPHDEHAGTGGVPLPACHCLPACRCLPAWHRLASTPCVLFKTAQTFIEVLLAPAATPSLLCCRACLAHIPQAASVWPALHAPAAACPRRLHRGHLAAERPCALRVCCGAAVRLALVTAAAWRGQHPCASCGQHSRLGEGGQAAHADLTG